VLDRCIPAPQFFESKKQIIEFVDTPSLPGVSICVGRPAAHFVLGRNVTVGESVVNFRREATFLLHLQRIAFRYLDGGIACHGNPRYDLLSSPLFFMQDRGQNCNCGFVTPLKFGFATNIGKSMCFWSWKVGGLHYRFPAHLSEWFHNTKATKQPPEVVSFCCPYAGGTLDIRR